MGIFGDKDSIVGAALGVGGAFDKNRKTDSATVFGAALGASIGYACGMVYAACGNV